MSKIDRIKIVEIGGSLYYEDSIFNILNGFRPVEVLEQNQNVLKTRFENDEGDEKIVTQTENEINIKWDE